MSLSSAVVCYPRTDGKDFSNNVAYCRNSVQSVEQLSNPSRRNYLRVNSNSVSNIQKFVLKIFIGGQERDKNGTQLKPNKKFIQSSIVSILVEDIDTNIRLTLKLLDFQCTTTFSTFLHNVVGGHGTRSIHTSCKKRQHFTATFFSAMFCGSEILFVPSHTATRLCLIQCITNLTEVVSNFETDIDKKNV